METILPTTTLIEEQPAFSFAGRHQNFDTLDIDLHSHQNLLEIVFCSNVTGTTTVQNRNFNFFKDCLILHNKYDLHSEKYVALNSQAAIYYFTISNLKIKNLPALTILKPNTSPILTLDTLDACFIKSIFQNIILELEQKRYSYINQVQNYIQIIVNYIIRYLFESHYFSDSNTNPNAAIHKIRDYIDHNFCKSDFTLEKISKQFFLSQSSLTHLFHIHYKITPRQYIIEKKINLAKQYLMTTSQSIETIASSLGYATPRQFIRLFKDNLKMTPSEFRKSSSIYDSHNPKT